MTTPSTSARMHYGYIIVACCCLIMGVDIGLTFSCAGIFYRPVSESLGVSVGSFGIYMSIMYITSTLMLPYAGRLIERYSARWLLTGSSALMGLVFVSMAFYSSLWEFYAAGAVLGLTLAFLLYLSFPTLVNRWFHTRVGLMIGICSAASGVGGMLFNPLGGWLITTWGWRWAYALFGLLILLIVSPLLALFLSDSPKAKGLLPFGYKAVGGGAADKPFAPEAEGMTYGEARRTPLFYALVFFAFLMMGTSTLNLFIPGFVTDHGFSLEAASFTAAAAMAGVTIGKLALGWVNDRNCSAGVAVTCGAGAAGLLLMLVAAGSLPLIATGAFLFGWAYAGVTVQSAMLTRAVFGVRDYARIYATMSMGLAAGGAIASGGWGLLSDATSLAVSFTTGAILLLLCLLIGLYALRRR